MDEITLYLNPLTRSIQQLETISQNVANVNTPGFNAQLISSTTEGESILITKTIGHSIRDTGRELDIGIKGDAFFLIEKDGEVYLTKNGRFTLSENLELMHQSGGYALAEGGKVKLSENMFELSDRGEIIQQGASIGKLTLVKPSYNAPLKAIGNGLYMVENGHFEEVESSIKKGALNNSNVNPAYEMSRLLQLNRYTESLQKAANTYHEMLSKGISDIGGE